MTGTTTGDPGGSAAVDPVPSTRLAAAIRPLLERVGGRLVPADEAGADDVILEWDGEPMLHVRLVDDVPEAPADLSDGLARLIAEVEKEIGGRLSGLPRAEKQRAVRLLEERGAFEMRKSAETVAEALGVTRFTVYNYLNRA